MNTDDSDSTLLNAARTVLRGHKGSSVGRRQSDVWRARLNKMLTLLCTAFIVMLAIGCDEMRKMILVIFA